MGSDTVTQRNVKVVRVDAEANILVVKGAEQYVFFFFLLHALLVIAMFSST